jgi:N-acyl-D-amino-acid deacylase
MHDLVIRGGTIVDGTGAKAYCGDVAIDGGTIAAVGGKVGPGRREIDADGALVLPGWVDVHTHYDGQVTWDPLVGPSCWHGVTTIVMGNCGVGFAPVRPHMHNDLIELMEGVEDIPGAALHEGVNWQWKSFPQFMDTLGQMNHAVDIGVQVPHSPVRAYVMGDGAASQTASEDQMAQMARIVEEGLASGALGFTTSRTKFHRTSKNELVPSHFADLRELRVIGQAMKRHGSGLIGVLSDFDDPESDMAGLRQLSAESGRPLYYLLVQFDDNPNKWRRMLDLSRPNGDGPAIRPQICTRPVGFFLGLECSLHPFMSRDAYKEIKDLPLAERVQRMRDPAFKQRVISQTRQHKSTIMREVTTGFEKMCRLGDPPDYEPAQSQSIAAMAARKGRALEDLAYDILLERGGKELIFLPFTNYTARNHDVIREMMQDEQTLFGLGDGGAHCGLICDASIPTYLLTNWVRDRTRGDRLPLEWIVKQQTGENAKYFGLHDRGVLAPGMKADINLIDFERLQLLPPHIVNDLPAGGRRLIQEACGYIATIQSGVVTFENSVHSGALPGGVIRGHQAGPR